MKEVLLVRFGIFVRSGNYPIPNIAVRGISMKSSPVFLIVSVI